MVKKISSIDDLDKDTLAHLLRNWVNTNGEPGTGNWVAAQALRQYMAGKNPLGKGRGSGRLSEKDRIHRYALAQAYGVERASELLNLGSVGDRSTLRKQIRELEGDPKLLKRAQNAAIFYKQTRDLYQQATGDMETLFYPTTD